MVNFFRFGGGVVNSLISSFSVNDAVLISCRSGLSMRRVIAMTPKGLAVVYKEQYSGEPDVLIETDDWVHIGRYQRTFFGTYKFIPRG